MEKSFNNINIPLYSNFLGIANVNHLGGPYEDPHKVEQFNIAKSLSDKLGLPLNIQKETTTTFQEKQTRLLHTFEATMQEAGHSSLLNAEALGETGAHLRGELSSENLHKIFKDTARDTRWVFTQNPDGSIEPVATTKKLHTFSDGRMVPAVSRAELANKVVNHVNQHVLLNTVDAVLSNTVNSANLAERTGYAESAFNEYLKANSAFYVKLAKTAGYLELLAKKVPELGVPVAAVASLYAAAGAASANTTDDALTRTSKALNAATEDIGGGAARAAAAGDYDTAQRKALDLVVPDADQILRSKEVQAVIDALPKDRESLSALQSDTKRAPIDRHLAEYQLQYLDAKEKGKLIDGMSASSTLTNLAEMKVKLEAQWKADAETFTAATKSPDTNWSQFKKEHPELAIQADLHQAAVNTAVSNPNIPPQFVKIMDDTIARNTAQGTPMEQVQARLNALDLQAQQQMTQQNAALSVSR